MRQSISNPFPYSNSNKRYYTYDYYMKQKYGGKCAKIPLDAGFTCPNIDGKCGYGGCIYCSGRGSGDFAEPPTLSITDQFNITRKKLSSKWSTDRCIAYFQAHTNTYAPLSVIKEKFEEAASLPNVVGISIATRADCLCDDVIAYLNRLSERTDITVELGLQTVHDSTASFINRGHTFDDFKAGYNRLKKNAPNVTTCIHLIFGLPGENEDMMLNSVKEVARLHPNQVKIHLLHIIEGTKMAEIYNNGMYEPMERQAYIDTVCRALTLLPEDVVIGRLTGDGMSASLLAPDWSRKKVTILNDIDRKMYENNLYQGQMFQNSIN